MKRNFINSVWVFFSCLVLLSCNKEEIPAQKDVSVTEKTVIDQLKTLYASELKDNRAVFVFSQGEPEWDKAKFSGIANNYLIPVRTGFTKKNDKFEVQKFLRLTVDENKMSGDYLYIISEKDKQLENIDQALAKINFAETGNEKFTTGLPGIVKSPLKTGKDEKQTGIHSKLNILPTKRGANGAPEPQNILPEACTGVLVQIDWYYQQYDNYGNLIYEEYLYSTTECWGENGGGGGSGDPTVNCSQAAIGFVSEGSSVSELLSSNTTLSKPLDKVDRYNWKIYSAGTWGIVSWDVINWKRTSATSAWTYFSYSHSSDSEVGASFGGTRTYTILETYATNLVSSAIININYKVKHQAICDGLPAIFLPAVTVTERANKMVIPVGVVVAY